MVITWVRGQCNCFDAFKANMSVLPLVTIYGIKAYVCTHMTKLMLVYMNVHVCMAENVVQMSW